MKISHTLETTATPAAVWRVWTAVSRWPEWDSELVSAALEGDFQLGAIGWLRPRSGPTATFVISQISPGESYRFTTQLPLCKLHVRRFLHCRYRKLYFTHEVFFEGLLAPVFSRVLGKQFQQALPGVMQALKTIAELEDITECLGENK